MNSVLEPALDALVFAPHPDDAEVGMGGTLAKLAAMEKRVGVADMTRGELGTKGDAEIRAREAEEASRILGLTLRINLDLGDGKLADTEENRRRVTDVIRQTRPAHVFVTTTFDRHPDHRAAAELVSAAFFLARLPKWETAYPAHSPRRCVHYYMHDVRDVRFVVDITEHFEKKKRALEAFASQFVNPMLPEGYRYAGIEDYLGQLEALNRALGTQVGVKYAEGFYTPGPVLAAHPLLFD